MLYTPLFNNNGSMYIWSYTSVGQGNELYSISPQGKLLWTKEVFGIESAAVSSNGTIYCGGLLNSTDKSPSLWAIGSNGSMEWVNPFRNGDFYSIRIGPDGGIYTLFSTLYSEPQVGGTRIAKFGQDGRLLWYLSPGNDISFGSLGFMTNGTLMSYSSDSHFNWIDANGSILWRGTISTPVDYCFFVNDTLYGVLDSYADPLWYGGLYHCNLNGSVLWRYVPGIQNVSLGSEMIQDAKGMLYYETSVQTATGYPKSLVAFDQNGTVHWKYQQGTMSFPALYDGQIVVVNNDGITALDNSGNVKWTLDGISGWAIYSSNGQLYVIGQNTITVVGDSTSILTTDGALIGVLLISVGLVTLLAIWIVNETTKRGKNRP